MEQLRAEQQVEISTDPGRLDIDVVHVAAGIGTVGRPPLRDFLRILRIVDVELDKIDRELPVGAGHQWPHTPCIGGCIRTKRLSRLVD